tara:strand:+ start:297 stop:863 length:567 start_codon:yes stop_codon:yes gene_type:complete
MNSYKVLKKQLFSIDNYSVIPIRYEDRLSILKWRNEQLYHLRQEKKLTKNDQENYFNNIVNKLFDQDRPNQILFSFLKDNICIGYGGLVHINWVNKNAELSFIMDTELEKKSFSMYWNIFLKLIEEVAFNDLNFHKIFTYAFNLRPHLFEAIESADFKYEATLKNHYFFKESYYDVIIHSKFNKLHYS